jgi:hypothetical protein
VRAQAAAARAAIAPGRSASAPVTRVEPTAKVPAAPPRSQPAPTTAKAPAAPAGGPSSPARSEGAPTGKAAAAPGGSFKDALLAEIRASKAFFYNTVVAQAQRIDVTDDRVTFTFLPTHKALRDQFEQSRAWLEAAAERVAGRKVTVSAAQADLAPDAAAASAPAASTEAKADAKRDLKAAALESSAVQAMLDVFPAEIRDVEEM